MRIANDEAIITELNKIMQETGRFPTFRELGIRKRFDIIAALQKHGGNNKFRKLLGVKLLRVPDGFWTPQRLNDELSHIKNELGHVPTYAELIKLKRHDLINALKKQHRGNKSRKECGHKPLQRKWTHVKIIHDLTKITNKLNHFPTSTELINMGREDLRGAIIRYYGAVKDFRKLIDIQTDSELKKPDPFSEDWVLNELKKIIKKLGTYPTSTNLRSMNRKELYLAIVKHGGTNKFRNLLGYPDVTRGRSKRNFPERRIPERKIQEESALKDGISEGSISKVSTPEESHKEYMFTLRPQLHVKLNLQCHM